MDDAHLQLARLLATHGDKKQASSELQKAVELAPGLTEAHRALAQLAADSGDQPSAIRELEAVVAWTPDNASAHYDLAIALKAVANTTKPRMNYRLRKN